MMHAGVALAALLVAAPPAGDVDARSSRRATALLEQVRIASDLVPTDPAKAAALLLPLARSPDLAKLTPKQQTAVAAATGWALLEVGRAAEAHPFLVRATTGPAEDRALLQALFDRGWKQMGREPVLLWRRLVLRQLQAGDRERARAILPRIVDPLVLVSMRADRRYDGAGITPDAISAASESAVRAAHVTLWRDGGFGNRVRLELVRALLRARRPEEVLTATAAFDPELGYEYELRSARARAHLALGQPAEAVRSQERALDTAPLLDEVAALALLHCELGRPREALRVLERPLAEPAKRDERWAIAQLARLWAAVQLRDDTAARGALSELDGTRASAPRAHLWGLVVLGRTDEAAELVVAGLRDPERRPGLLVLVQDHERLPATPAWRTLDERWRAVLERPAVKEAIEAVGRRERYRLVFPIDFEELLD